MFPMRVVLIICHWIENLPTVKSSARVHALILVVLLKTYNHAKIVTSKLLFGFNRGARF